MNLNIGMNFATSSTSSTLTISTLTQSSIVYGSTATNTIANMMATTVTTVTNNHLSIASVKTTYNVLGKDIEVDGYKDIMTALYVSMINLQGKAFYDEVKKQNVNFPREIEKYLNTVLVSWERERKIDSIL